jgi:hypothetical protein
VLPLDFKPAHNVGDLVLQHLDALEQEAEEKGGVQQVLAEHFAKVYKVNQPLSSLHSSACTSSVPQGARLTAKVAHNECSSLGHSRTCNKAVVPLFCKE